MSIRPVKRLIEVKPTVEGAGVHLRRAFGFGITKTVIPSCCWTTSATMFGRTIWRVFHGIRTGITHGASFRKETVLQANCKALPAP
jgi:hypothetical protein